MDTALIHIFVGCLLIIGKIGLIQSLTYCQRRHQVRNRYLVNVCQNNNKSVETSGDILIIDAAGAPLQEDILCKCNLSFIHVGSRPYSSAYIFLEIDSNQNVEFKVNGHVYKTNTEVTTLNFTSDSMIKFRQRHQKDTPRACFGIQKATTGGSLTLLCRSNRNKHPATTSETHSMQEINSTLSPTNKEGTTSDLTVILCTVGAGLLLTVIGIIGCYIIKRKRKLAKKYSKCSREEPTNPSTEGTVENAAAMQRTKDKHETDSIRTSDYVDVDHCDAIASTNVSSTTPAENDMYNHLNEIQPGPHSDNVYSTTNSYNTTTKESSVMSEHGSRINPPEGDMYNHLNEVRPSPLSDNIYNATHIQEADAASSQYDSVELINRQHNAKPDNEYNVLSFP